MLRLLASGRRRLGGRGGRVLQPPDLGGRAVALVVFGRDTEDDGRLGGGVDMRGRQRRVIHDGLVLGAAVDAHEGQLAGHAGDGLGVALRLYGRVAHRQAHRVLDDLARVGRRRLPRQVRTLGRLGDLDGGGRTRKARQAGLEGRYVAPFAAAVRVDGAHPELVGGAGQQLDLMAVSVVRQLVRVDGQVLVGEARLVEVLDHAAGALDDANVAPRRALHLDGLAGGSRRRQRAHFRLLELALQHLVLAERRRRQRRQRVCHVTAVVVRLDAR